MYICDSFLQELKKVLCKERQLQNQDSNLKALTSAKEMD